jgi:Protein of unknown function (DUF3307)
MLEVTGLQLVCHGIGDYVLQSDWMANEKNKKSRAALVHALTYTAPFLLATQNLLSLAAICITHFVVDRWRLARYLCYAKKLHGS